MKKSYTVAHRQEGWAVVRDGASRASSRHKTQSSAISAGRPLAQSGKGELRIQGTDGKYRESWSYGNDPYPPKG